MVISHTTDANRIQAPQLKASCSGQGNIRFWALVFALSAAAHIWAQEPGCHPLIAAPMSLRGYDCGGIRTGGFLPPAVSIQVAEMETRQFIWSHFTSMHLGYISLVLYTKEGDRSETTYYVCRDSTGKWAVQWFGKRREVNRRGRGMLPLSTFHGTAYSVARLDNTDANQRKIVPPSLDISADRYRLQFADAAGVAIGEL